MPSATVPPTARIPAWQRLGLKLKSARPQEQTPESPVVPEPLKRKSVGSIEYLPSKKVKKTSKNPLLPISTEELVTPNLARKKSVTFTPETKVEDGDSIKQLFSAWVAEQKSQDPSFQPKSSQAFDTPEPPRIEEQIDTTLNEKERRVKRAKKSEDSANQSRDTTKQKKPKSPKPSKVTKTTKAPTRPFLVYLKQYHESRDTWKFNKNHQNHLLKHVFNIDVIPLDHAHLIYEYVRGLQGGVRTRLRDAAFAIKVKDQEDGLAGFPENMADRDKRQREYDMAMKEYVATMTVADASKTMGYEEGVLLGLSDAAMADRVAKRMRAEQIFAELDMPGEGMGEASGVSGPKMSYDDDDSQKRLRMSDGSLQKVVRKRKQRTATADDDTSSSDESSDSESNSDDDSEPINRHAQVESSSSSSSSSSSGSEDEDEDDDENEEDDSEESDSD